MKRAVVIPIAIASTAVLGLATPASAAVDLEVKRAIVAVVLDNLGVSASDAFVASIAQELDASQLDTGLVTSVNNLLDTGADPRSVIESQTDQNGDGVPDEGAALAVQDDDASESTTPGSSTSSHSSGDDSSSSNNSNSTNTPKPTKTNNSTPSNNDDDNESENQNGTGNSGGSGNSGEVGERDD